MFFSSFFSLYSASVSFLRFLYRCCVPRVLSVLNEVLFLFTFLCSESFPPYFMFILAIPTYFLNVCLHMFSFLCLLSRQVIKFYWFDVAFFLFYYRVGFSTFCFYSIYIRFFIRLGFLFVFSDSSADVLSSFLS